MPFILSVSFERVEPPLAADVLTLGCETAPPPSPSVLDKDGAADTDVVPVRVGHFSRLSLSLSQGSNAHISSSSRPVCPVPPEVFLPQKVDPIYVLTNLCILVLCTDLNRFVLFFSFFFCFSFSTDI